MKKRNIKKTLIGMAFVLCLAASVFSGCGSKSSGNAGSTADGENKIKVKVLILPKFETGELTGDELGEAQLTYENYIMGENEQHYELANGKTLYFNPDNGIAMAITESGKTIASSTFVSILLDSRFDFSESWFLGIGCSGASTGVSTIGDITVCAEVVDGDLGHMAGYSDYENPDARESFWYHDASYDNNSHVVLNQDLVQKVYELTKDVPLRTTEMTQTILERNFPGEEWANRDPKVIIGTHLTADNFWKGKGYHKQSNYVAKTYGTIYPYTTSEMEDAALAVVAKDFGILDRLILLRAQVNLDVFLDNQTPDELWGEGYAYNDAVKDVNQETLDIFEPAMHNMFDVEKIVVDAMLDGSL